MKEKLRMEIKEKNSLNDPTLKKFKDSKSVFVGPAYTAEQYRENGFHIYDLVEGCKYYFPWGGEI